MIFVRMKVEFFQHTQLVVYIIIEFTAINRHIIIDKRKITHPATYQLHFACRACTGLVCFGICIASRIQSDNVVQVQYIPAFGKALHGENRPNMIAVIFKTI